MCGQSKADGHGEDWTHSGILIFQSYRVTNDFLTVYFNCSLDHVIK